MTVTGADLRAMRKRLRRHQTEMAEDFGVTPLTWLRWEKSAGEIPLIVRLALSAWLQGLGPWNGEPDRK